MFDIVIHFMLNSYCEWARARTKGAKMLKTESITIRIESEKLLQLEEMAKKEDMPVSALVRKILKEYILDKWSNGN